MQVELTDEQRRERRRRLNAKRKESRRRCAALRALPPVVGLSRAEFFRIFGEGADYDAYADAFIAGALAKRRRYEFPLEPLAGVSYPSLKRHRKGMPAGA